MGLLCLKVETYIDLPLKLGKVFWGKRGSNDMTNREIENSVENIYPSAWIKYFKLCRQLFDLNITFTGVKILLSPNTQSF